MATFYSAIGRRGSSQHFTKLAGMADKRLPPRDRILGWSHTGVMQHQFVEAEGGLAHRLGTGFRFKANTAWVANSIKFAPTEDVWQEICTLFPLFGEQACLIESNGTILAVRQNDKVWLSYRDGYMNGEDDWPTFAKAQLDFPTITALPQAQMHHELNKNLQAGE